MSEAMLKDRKAESSVSTRRRIKWRSLLCEMESVLKEGKEAGRVKQGGVLKGPDGKASQPPGSSHDFCLGSRVVNDHFHAHTRRRIRTLLHSSLMNQFFFKEIKAESRIRNCGNHIFKISPYSEYRKEHLIVKLERLNVLGLRPRSPYRCF